MSSTTASLLGILHLAVAVAFGLVAPASSATASELVLAWNDLTLRAVRHGSIPPPMAVRQMALVHLAMFDALNGIDRRYQAYLVSNAAPTGCSREAALTEAAHHVLRTLLPKSAELFDSHRHAILAAIPEGPARTNGMDWGRRVAAEFIKSRQFDGAGQAAGFDDRGGPGRWQRTPPNYDKPLLPGWGALKPFALAADAPDPFRPAPPPALASSAWARQFNQVRQLGATNSTTRTADQRTIALFWADGPGTETPPGHWNKIAQQLARHRRSDLLDTARLFAALNVALADAGVVCWQAKYAHAWWRPITAIRAGPGADDGNPATDPDPAWWPLLITPPFPEHPSGHSSFSGAAAAVLEAYHGSDEFPFTTVSDGLPGVVRRFRRFSDAAREAGLSRIYGGIHFAAANEEGLASGRRIGAHIAHTWFQQRSE